MLSMGTIMIIQSHHVLSLKFQTMHTGSQAQIMLMLSIFTKILMSNFTGNLTPESQTVIFPLPEET